MKPEKKNEERKKGVLAFSASPRPVLSVRVGRDRYWDP